MSVIEITIALQEENLPAFNLPSLLLPSRMSQGIWEILDFVFRVVFSFLSYPSDITVK